MEDAFVSFGTVDPVPFFTDHYTDLQVTPVQVKEATSKRPRNGPDSGNYANRRQYDEWSQGAVNSLLDIYEKKYLALQRGKLVGRHWLEVAHHVSAREDGTKSAKTRRQCSRKIDDLKRRYKMKKTQRVGNPALEGTDRWPYYDRLDRMLRITPKALAGGQRDCADTLSGSEPSSSQKANPKSKGPFLEPAVECDGESEMPAALAVAEDRELSPDVGDGDHEEGIPQAAFGSRKDSKRDASEVNTKLNMLGTSGARKLPVRSSLSSNPSVILANSITAFSKAFSRIEKAKMEMHEVLERQRTEADLKRTQMMLDKQLEIAKLVIRRLKRKGRSVSSSSESE